MSSNPLRQKLLTPTEYVGMLVGARPPEEDQEPQNIFDAVYRVLPQQQYPSAPMPFPDAPPPYQNPALPPRGMGGGWGQ